jgi:hypothetical protein
MFCRLWRAWSFSFGVEQTRKLYAGRNPDRTRFCFGLVKVAGVGQTHAAQQILETRVTAHRIETRLYLKRM